MWTMRGDDDVRVVYSRDQQARAEMQHWEQVAESAPRWRPRHRWKAEMRAEAARERALSAGVDWSLVPRPPEGLRAPDRSRRSGGGRDRPPADSRPSPPPQPSGSGQSALSGLHLTMQLAAAPVASGHAAEQAPGEHKDDRPPREPDARTLESNGSQEPGRPAAEDGDVTPPASLVPSDADGAATPPATPPPPAAPPPVTQPPVASAAAQSPVASVATAVPAAATSGGGVGLAYGSADVGSLTAVSAVDWLDTGPQTVYEDPGGGGFLQAPDGGLWYQDAAGLTYALGPDGTYYALGDDGYLYGQTADGGYFTWTEDGTQLLADEQGLLWAYTDDGQPMVLGDDGLYYPPDAWAEPQPLPQDEWVATEPPLEQASLDTHTEFAGYAEQPGVTEPGPTPGLGELAPDPLWFAEDDDPGATVASGESSAPFAFGDPFSVPGPLLPESSDDGTEVEPSLDEPLPPLEDPPPLYEDALAAESGYLAEEEDTSERAFDQPSDEPPAQHPFPGWTDGTLDI